VGLHPTPTLAASLTLHTPFPAPPHKHPQHQHFYRPITTLITPPPTPHPSDLVVGGVPLTLLDTAGIRASTDRVEAIGVQRSQLAAAAADIVLMVVDAAEGWTEADGEIFKALWGKGPGARDCKVKGMALMVANKADLAGEGRSVASGWVGGVGEGGGFFWGGRQDLSAMQLHAALQHLQSAAGCSTSSTLNRQQPPVTLKTQGGHEVPLPLPVKDAFHAVVRTCAVSRDGLSTLEEAILQVRLL